MPRGRRLEEGTIMVKKNQGCGERMRASSEESKSATGAIMRRASLRASGWNTRCKNSRFWVRFSMLESKGDLMRGDCAFAENHPGVSAAGEINDGGGGSAGGGAAVDN